MRVLRAVAISGLALAGCVSFPEEYLVDDLRILEIRTEPPELRLFEDAPLNVDPADILSQRFDLRMVKFTALVAHPDLDATFEQEWIRCTAEVSDGFSTDVPSTGFQRVPCSPPERISLGTGPELELSPIALVLADIAQAGGDPVGVISTLAEDPRDLFAGLYANFNLKAFVRQADVAGDTIALEGTKRVVIFDPTVVALVIQEARRRGPDALPMIEGIPTPSLCTRASADQLGSIFAYLENRVPNRAPKHLGLVRLATDSSTRALLLDEAITLEPGEQLDLVGLVAPDDLESYEIINDNCNLIALDETMAFSWFTNRGSLAPQITSRSKEDRGLDNDVMSYVAPTEFEGDELRVRIWSVLRDGRGGSDSRQLDVTVRR